MISDQPKDAGIELGRADLVGMYRKMRLIREFDENLPRLCREGLVTGSTHCYTGQEAVAVGACAALRSDDYVSSHHRGDGHCIAKGLDPKLMMAEILGRSTGYCRGKGGQMHITDMRLGFLGGNGIVGAGIPIAVGAALASKLSGTNRVTLCFFGDAATNLGVFHESANMAAIWRLPVVFVCENNLYGLSTRITETIAVKDIATRAAAYGFPGRVVDGNDVLAVYEAVSGAVKMAREGTGPSLIECKTYRWHGHWIGDPMGYRSEEELGAWKARDPIVQFRRYLKDRGALDEEADEALGEEIRAEVEDAILFASNSAAPSPEELYDGIYARPIKEAERG